MRNFVISVVLFGSIAVSFLYGKSSAYSDAELRWLEKEAFNRMYVREVEKTIESIGFRFDSLVAKNDAKDGVIAELRAYLRLENMIVPKRHDKFLAVGPGKYTGVGGN